MSPTPPRPSAPPLSLKPTHAPVRAYYTALAQLANVGATHESAVREAWHRLIEHCAGPLKWTLVRDYPTQTRHPWSVRLSGALIDDAGVLRGAIRSCAGSADLEMVARCAIGVGFPLRNTLFWQPHRAMLFRRGRAVLDLPLTGLGSAPIEENLELLLSRFLQPPTPTARRNSALSAFACHGSELL
jgi:hypothetical protein